MGRFRFPACQRHLDYRLSTSPMMNDEMKSAQELRQARHEGPHPQSLARHSIL